MALADKPLEIPCPGCKTKMRTSLSALARSNKLVCPSCKAETTVNGDARAPAAALNKLDQTLSRFGKRR